MTPWGTVECRFYLVGAAFIMGLPFGKVPGVHLLNKQEVLKSKSVDDLLDMIQLDGFITCPTEGTFVFLPNDHIYITCSTGSKYARWSVLGESPEHQITAHNNYERIFAAYPSLRQTTYKRWGSIITGLATC